MLEIETSETDEGFIAWCRGADRPFSFLVGQDLVSSMEIKGNRVFVARGSHAQYLLQLVVVEVAPNFAGLPEGRDLDVLAAHHRWETGFQAGAGTLVTDEDSLVVGELREGKPYLAWGGRVPDSSRGHVEGSVVAATPFAGFSAVRNVGELLFFGVQGLGEGWSYEGVKLKAMRIAVSVCFAALGGSSQKVSDRNED
jgi:hypothetical protein